MIDAFRSSRHDTNQMHNEGNEVLSRAQGSQTLTSKMGTAASRLRGLSADRPAWGDEPAYLASGVAISAAVPTCIFNGITSSHSASLM